jgi:hypothetical protein
VTVRKCSTCKHYEPAPIWRKGWCRNPLLYSPQQSHLVGEDDLDCDRGMGNYWEPIDGPVVGATARGSQATEQHPEQRLLPPEPDDFSNVAMSSNSGPRATTSRTTDDRGGEMSQYPPSGPRRNIDDFDEDEDVGRPSSPSDPNRTGGNDRQFTYYPEERYWTDYLRIAAPVLGVIILLGLAWFWLSHLIGGSSGGSTPPASTSTSGNPVIITGSPSASSIAGAPTVVSTATSTTSGSGTPSTTGGGKLASGASAEVANTGGSGVNMRDAPTTGGNVVGTLSDGTAVTITGDSVDADGYTWWPVKTSDGTTGYIVADYLNPSSQ